MKYQGNCKVRNSYFVSTIFLFILILSTLQAKAQEQIPDTLVKERIQYIQKMLDEGRPGASLWWNGWLYGYGAATVGQGVVFLTSDKLTTRQDMALGAATSFIGAIGQLIAPMPISAPKKLALIPGETAEQRMSKLKQAENLFEAGAKRELEGRSLKTHAINGAVNLGSGLVTWLGFKRTVWAGIGNFALNTAICEAQILSQPRRAIRDYNTYREKYISGLPQAHSRQEMHWTVNAFPGGVSVRLIF